MKDLLAFLFPLLAQWGGFSLLIVGALDSSFLFLPLGNDLLMVGLTAARPDRLPFHALLAAAGSLAGVALVDWLARKGGEAGLARFLPPKRIDSVRRRVSTNAGWTLVLAALLPPPFPFTPFVAAAAALQYPRARLLALVGMARLLRFMLLGWLAVFFGRQVIAWADTPVVRYGLLGLLALMVVGSTASVWGWVQRGRSFGAAKAEPVPQGG